MRVLTIVNWLNRGGIEVQLLNALPFIKASGISMDICCTGGAGELDSAYEALGCRILHMPKKGNAYAVARDLSGLLSQNRYEVVHSNFGYESGGFSLACRRMGIPFIVSIHNAKAESLLSWKGNFLLRGIRAMWLQWHRRLMMENVDVFVGHSVINVAALFPRWQENAQRFRVIMNGISFPDRDKISGRSEARAALGIGLSETVLLHVGSMTAKKNHQGLLRIFALFHETFPQSILLMVGDGPLREEIRELAARLGIEKSVVFCGIKSNVWPYYAAADCFVFPSNCEGFGNVLVEAQGVRLPIVASDIPAHRESVAPGQKKFLFAIPNYQCACELITEQVRAAREGTNPWVTTSEHYVRANFTSERLAADLCDLYRDVAGRAQ